MVSKRGRPGVGESEWLMIVLHTVWTLYEGHIWMYNARRSLGITHLQGAFGMYLYIARGIPCWCGI